MAAKEVKPIRFDPVDLKDSEKLNIDISETCRNALKEAIWKARKKVFFKDHNGYEFQDAWYNLEIEFTKEDTSFSHAFGTKRQHQFVVTGFKVFTIKDGKIVEVKNKALVDKIFDSYEKFLYRKDVEELDND